MYDVIIIGAGITGAAIAMELSKYQLNVAWLEKHNDVAMETTRANSGIVHAGFDPKPGTNKARLNVPGARLYRELAPLLNIHYKAVGSLVVGRTEEDLELLQTLYRRGLENGVEGLEILDEDRLREMEPELCSDIRFALYAPTAGIISPWEACLAFAQTAVHNGVQLYRNHEVTSVTKAGDGYRITAGGKEWHTKAVINCAGVHADTIFAMVNRDPTEAFVITPVKGQYYLLDKSQGDVVRHVVFQTPGAYGKGVLVSGTVHGNLIVGPDAQTVDDKSDVSVNADNLKYVAEAAQRTTERIQYKDNIRNFAGLRAKISGHSDFLIAESKANPGFINFAGIQSPGLSCGPMFGLEAVRLLKAAGLAMTVKGEFEYLPLPKSIRDMTQAEINERIQQNPLYGRIVCRCETVSEGEILDAIHQTVGATTVDGVKRRTNAGMGRCQGGFCGPKVLELLRRELGLKATEVLQDQQGSYLVAQDKGSD